MSTSIESDGDSRSFETHDDTGSFEIGDDSRSLRSSDEELEAIKCITGEVLTEHSVMYLNKQPYRNDILTGREYVHNVSEGNKQRFPDLFRMKPEVLYELFDILRARGLLCDSRNVSVEEQMCMFLYTIRHANSTRVVADRFQHSGKTVSRYFGKVLKAVCKFSKDVIRPPNFNTRHPYIRSKGDKYYPWFKDCIGTIDGTHVIAYVAAGTSQIPYRGRKTIPTQNVMCACDFDLCFTYVLAGWEGTVNDSRVFWDVVLNPCRKFPHAPDGKYYVVDSGYPNVPGFLPRYKGERYHLNEYQGRDKGVRTAKEKFNFAHSSLRTVIERCFGVLKQCFHILRMMPSCSLRKQQNFVIVTCALHNFIRRHSLSDDIFDEFSVNDDMVVDDESEGVRGSGRSSIDIDRSQRGRRETIDMRDQICRNMAIHYRLPL